MSICCACSQTRRDVVNVDLVSVCAALLPGVSHATLSALEPGAAGFANLDIPGNDRRD